MKREDVIETLSEYLMLTGDRQVIREARHRAACELKARECPIAGIALHLGVSERQVYRLMEAEKDEEGKAKSTRLYFLIRRKLGRKRHTIGELARSLAVSSSELQAYMQLLSKLKYVQMVEDEGKEWWMLAGDDVRQMTFEEMLEVR